MKIYVLPRKKKLPYSLFVVCLFAAGFMAMFPQPVLAGEIHDKNMALVAETELTNKQGAYSALNGIRAGDGVVNQSRSVDNLLGKQRAEKSDGKIKQDIEKELRQSPFVDSEKVTVTVKSGVATLTGTVDSWTEYADAEANAYQGGAKEVRNYLKLMNDHIITQYK